MRYRYKNNKMNKYKIKIRPVYMFDQKEIIYKISFRTLSNI